MKETQESVRRDSGRMKGTLTWGPRLFALAVFAVSLPFYIGMGNIWPFGHPDLSLWDLFWRVVAPLSLVGLLLGWASAKAGGLLTTAPIFTGFVVGLIFSHAAAAWVFLPFLAGVAYLASERLKDQWSNRV